MHVTNDALVAARPSEPSGTSGGGPLRRLRAVVLWRRRLGWLVLLVPVLAAVGTDFARRSDRLLALEPYYRWTYAGSVLESAFVWGLLLYAASRRRGVGRWISGGLFVVAASFAFGGQAYFYEQYNAYLNVDVSLFASNFMDSVVNQLFADAGNYLKAKAVPGAFALLLVVAGRRVLRPRPLRALVASILAPLGLLASFFIPTQHRHLQASLPDMLYLHAVGGLARTQLGFTDQSNQLRPRVRESLPVAAIGSRPPRPRNVVLVILESVRADAACIDYEATCRRTEYTNRLAPNRFPLRQLRSQASSTAISLAVLWAGVGPHESRDVLHTWPLVFDYARAAGWDTAFWTSQNMMFGNARLWVKNLGVSKFVSATDLDPTCDLDMGAPEDLLAAHVNREIGELREPFLAVVQLSNVHYPYWVRDDLPQPFQPATTSKAPEDNAHFFNQYQNSVHQQDLHVAAMLSHLRSSDAGRRTVVVYTSDHAEAFREHGQMGHTFSVLDEEIHVPGWIDAPPGTLTDEEAMNLRRQGDRYVFHADLSATVMDLMGVWVDRALDPYRDRMLGESLLRAKANPRAMPLTNCAGVWSCAFENWGYMRGTMKLEARSWDASWKCYDLAKDPLEKESLGAEACGDLKDLALQTFGRLPGKKRD